MANEDNNTSRRKIIKSIPAGALPLYATGTSMARQEEYSINPDTSFDPKDQEAVSRFLVSSFEKDNQRKIQALSGSATLNSRGVHNANKKALEI